MNYNLHTFRMLLVEPELIQYIIYHVLLFQSYCRLTIHTPVSFNDICISDTSPFLHITAAEASTLCY